MIGDFGLIRGLTFIIGFITLGAYTNGMRPGRAQEMDMYALFDRYENAPIAASFVDEGKAKRVNRRLALTNPRFQWVETFDQVEPGGYQPPHRQKFND